MKWLLLIGGIVLLLAFIDRLKLFGTTREIKAPDDPLLTARETAANVASVGGLLLRSAIETTKGLAAVTEELSRRAENMAAEARVDRDHNESPLGESLLFRQSWLAAMLMAERGRLEIQDELDADPQLARIYEELSKKDALEHPKPVISIGAQEELRQLGFGHLPASLRIVSIPFLCHFTRIENLPSILEHGIVPVAKCPERGIAPLINDKARFDRRTNTSSVSISHPNARMLHKYRQLHPDADWVVLAINTATALNLDTLFCRHNAADTRISCLSDAALRTNKAFQGMFERPTHYTGRARYNEPTDDQAEILIPRVIPPSEIQGIFFLSETGKSKHEPACENRAIFDPSQSAAIFGRRFDGSLSHSARIIRRFDCQIDKLAGEFSRDPRLFAALDKKIMEMTRNQNSVGLLHDIRWLGR